MIANSSSKMVPASSKAKKRELKEAETILCATEIKLGRDLYHDPEEAFLEKKLEGEKT